MKNRNKRSTLDLLLMVNNILKKYPLGLPISIIAKEANLDWESTNNFLNCLIELNSVEIYKMGKRRIYKLGAKKKMKLSKVILEKILNLLKNNPNKQFSIKGVGDKLNLNWRTAARYLNLLDINEIAKGEKIKPNLCLYSLVPNINKSKINSEYVYNLFKKTLLTEIKLDKK